MGQPAGSLGFRGWLERGLGSSGTAGGSSIAERMEQRVEAQVMGRVRALGGRTGGDDERLDHKGPRADEARGGRGASDPERAERTGRARPMERSHERDEQREDSGEGVHGALDPTTPRETPHTRSLDGRARSLHTTDAADASGAEAPSSEGASSTTAGVQAPVQPSAQQARAPVVNASAVHAASPASAAPVPASAGPNPSANVPHGAAVEGPRAASASTAAAAAEPLPRSTPAEELELAEQVMRQLRARLQLGQREALIELHPSELGRIRVHLRFEDGALTATIRAERPETLAVLESHAPELRAWLAQDGAEVREIDLGLAEHGALFDKPQQRQHDKALGRRSGSTSARERAPEALQALPRTNTSEATPGVASSSVDMLV